MPDATQLNLGPNEKEILAVASRIYAAELARYGGSVPEDLMDQAVARAIKLAMKVEHAVADEGERYDDKQDLGGGIEILR